MGEVAFTVDAAKAARGSFRCVLSQTPISGDYIKAVRAPCQLFCGGRDPMVKVEEMKLGDPDEKGRRKLVPTGEPDQLFECDDVLVAVGQENAFPWIERDCGIEFDKWDMPKLDEVTFQSSNPRVFFAGDAAFGPKNIIWAVAHAHEAAVSIDKMLSGEDITQRPSPLNNLVSQKMGIHEWSYDNDIRTDLRYKVPHKDLGIALKDIKAEVEPLVNIPTTMLIGLGLVVVACGIVGAPKLGTEARFDVNGVMVPGKRVMGIVEGDVVPQVFIPQLIDLHLQGRFPFDKLVKFYEFDQINEAIAESEAGRTIKPILRISSVA